MAKTCTRNGGLYIKLGQSLAIQAAVLPPPYKVAFESMFDASEPIPLQDVQNVWNHEFKERIEDVFDEFSQSPIACGSIAQVHKAKLRHTGEIVAVKVQRPAIPIQIEFDLFAYKSLLYVCEKAFGIPIYFIAQYVADQIRHETDFVREAKNSEKTSQYFESDPKLKNNILVPKVNWGLTTKRVLTTDFVEGGCRLTEEDKLKKNGIDKKNVMDLAMNMFSSMVFKFGWLHCDLHPGNVLVIKKDEKMKLALIDHGLYIQLPDKFRAEYCELWRSIFVLDTDSIQRIASGWGIANSELFASATLLRPFKSSKHSRPLKAGTPIDAPLTSYEKDLKIKDTLVGMLQNQKLIPNELIFIVRSMRMMQGNNQVLGSPSNRINILAHGAASGMTAYKVLSYGDGSVKEVTQDWLKHLTRLWTFQIALVFVDLGFLFTRIRQWWLRDVRGKRRGEGFEDLLQRQIETLAKEEFGITLDEKAFMG
ncbi:ABC1 family-domain-containing protein [Melampsora americana]|nr:ABC1 family-domain-containing protein [Melampsora americana]